MKKLRLKSKILLGAIMMGGMAAGAHAFSNLPNPADPTYRWTSSPDAPNHPSEVLDNATAETAKGYFECDGDGETCATGTLVSGDPGSPATAEIKLEE